MSVRYWLTVALAGLACGVLLAAAVAVVVDRHDPWRLIA